MVLFGERLSCERVEDGRIAGEIAAALGRRQALAIPGSGADIQVLVSAEHEQLVLQDWSAQSETCLIALQVVLLFGKELGRVQSGVPHKPKDVPVDLVRPRLGDDVYCARRADAMLRAHITGLDAELL